MTKTAYMTNEYRGNDVLGASPVRLVGMVFELSIKACEQGDFVKSTQALSVLRDGLDIDQGDIAINLFAIYQWCLDCVRKEDFGTALDSLRPLRDAWSELEKQSVAIPVQTLQVEPSTFVQVA